MNGIKRIIAERARQMRKWDQEHDSEHDLLQLQRTAAELLILPIKGKLFHDLWGLCKRYAGDTMRQLEVAGALVAAAIDREYFLKAQEAGTAGPDQFHNKEGKCVRCHRDADGEVHWCDTLKVYGLNTDRDNDNRKGRLPQLVVTNLDNPDEISVSGIQIGGGAGEQPLMLNHCPWCGELIRFWQPEPYSEED
jgi:hypothetical protein